MVQFYLVALIFTGIFSVWAMKFCFRIVKDKYQHTKWPFVMALLYVFSSVSVTVLFLYWVFYTGDQVEGAPTTDHYRNLFLGIVFLGLTPGIGSFSVLLILPLFPDIVQPE